ncbi:hypothetical protein F4778DRAFT_223477 [Xylariomycetidae sp. FL2044]|nr:hypothetical protein F4778DRAFT_223477 [Xylariomycetidae sp. FL2044]
MAPSGPRAGTGVQASRKTGSGKSHRGGINKRRGGTARVDRDGDLNMDSTAATNGSSRGAKRARDQPIPTGPSGRATRSSTAGSRPPRASARAQQMIQRAITGSNGRYPAHISHGSRPVNATQTMTIQVEGLQSSKAASKEDGGLKDLLTFLERKAQSVGKITRNIRIKKSQLNGDSVYITASKEDGEEILKLNGFLFATATLTISEATGGMPQHGQSLMSSGALQIKEQLQSVLSARYNTESKLLNLASLGEDPSLAQMGFFSGESRPEKLFRALMAICDGLFKTAKEKRDAVISISLRGNSIDDVYQIMSLADTFPDLSHLDLSQNQFKDLKGLQKWRHRLRNLETLLLNENPIETANPNYVNEVMGWFPRLETLSGAQVRTKEQIAAAEAASMPTPIPQNGADFRDINRVGEGFITDFLRMYDTDRHNLAIKYYDDQSTFSIAVNNRAPHAPDTPLPSWGAYLKFSRNHTKVTHPPARQQRLFIGGQTIQSAWQQLPATRHPDLVSQFDKYMIDCHPVHGLVDPTGQSPNGVDGMIMTIHGVFEDQDPTSMSTAQRSFSRTFVLGPGAPGRNPIRVVSDMLSVKVFTPLPTTAPVPAPQAVPQTVPQAVPQANDEARKQQMVVELSKQTGMTAQFSQFCLDGANWIFDQALASFNEKRAQLPPDAFAQI